LTKKYVASISNQRASLSVCIYIFDAFWLTQVSKHC